MTTINVTEENLKGDVGCNFTCPIAQALTDAGLQDVRVGAVTFSHVVGGQRILCDLPKNATNEMVNWFDRTFVRKPISFQVEI